MWVDSSYCPKGGWWIVRLILPFARRREKWASMRAAEPYRVVPSKRHTTVRIPRGMAETVEEFLDTEQAASMGFVSKADVVTTAVRNLLTEYGYYRTLQEKGNHRPPQKEKELSCEL